MRLQHGSSLVEVLVTLLILSVGLLGSLASQTVAIKQLQDAIARTQALTVANSFLQEYAANNALFTVSGSHLTSHSELPVSPLCNVAGACTATQLAASQLQQLMSESSDVWSRLPAADLCLNQQGNALAVSISWNKHSANVTPEAGSCAARAGRSFVEITPAG